MLYYICTAFLIHLVQQNLEQKVTVEEECTNKYPRWRPLWPEEVAKVAVAHHEVKPHLLHLAAGQPQGGNKLSISSFIFYNKSCQFSKVETFEKDSIIRIFNEWLSKIWTFANFSLLIFWSHCYFVNIPRLNWVTTQNQRRVKKCTNDRY